jgi:hypothetical protein
MSPRAWGDIEFMDAIERLWPLGWIAAAGGLAALGYAHLVASIFLPALLLLVVMASAESGD